jgi:hypothetical protein
MQMPLGKGLGHHIGLGGVSDWIAPRRNALLGFASGLAQGDNFGQGVAYGLQGAAKGRERDDAYATSMKEGAERQAQLNKTVEWAMSAFPEQLAGVPEHLIPDAAVKLWERSVTGQGGTYGLTPIWGVDASGNPVMGQMRSQGGIEPVQAPEGVTFGKEPIRINAGTKTILLDPVTRQVIGEIPIENEQAAYDSAFGAGQGRAASENVVSAESLASKMPGLRVVVDQLAELADQATYTQTGQMIDTAARELGMETSPAAVARAKYIAMVDNQVLPLLRDTFGAAFTQKEGEALRATLGDPNKSPAEKKAVLEAFIAQKERDVAAMMSRVPGQAQPTAPAGGGVQRFRFNPATGRVE